MFMNGVKIYTFYLGKTLSEKNLILMSITSSSEHKLSCTYIASLEEKSMQKLVQEQTFWVSFVLFCYKKHRTNQLSGRVCTKIKASSNHCFVNLTALGNTHIHSKQLAWTTDNTNGSKTLKIYENFLILLFNNSLYLNKASSMSYSRFLFTIKEKSIWLALLFICVMN